MKLNKARLGRIVVLAAALLAGAARAQFVDSVDVGGANYVVSPGWTTYKSALGDTMVLPPGVSVGAGCGVFLYPPVPLTGSLQAFLDEQFNALAQEGRMLQHTEAQPLQTVEGAQALVRTAVVAMEGKGTWNVVLFVAGSGSRAVWAMYMAQDDGLFKQWGQQAVRLLTTVRF